MGFFNADGKVVSVHLFALGVWRASKPERLSIAAVNVEGKLSFLKFSKSF